MVVLRVLVHVLDLPTFAYLTSQAFTMYRSISAIAKAARQMGLSKIALSSCACAGSLSPSIGQRPPLHLTVSIHSTSSLFRGKLLCTTFTTWSCTKRTTLGFISKLLVSLGSMHYWANVTYSTTIQHFTVYFVSGAIF